MASTFTQNLLLENPTPADPATNNTWGTTENTGRILVDSAVSGIEALSVAGAVNVTLTSTQGAADQSRNVHFIFSGVLTGNIIVLWPNGKTRVFSVANTTTGAFTLAAGVSNGGGAAAGTTTTVPQGFVMELVSDGTNVTQRITALTSPAISGGTVDNAIIGGTTAVAGTFSTVALKGGTSGLVTITPLSIAGTPTLVLPRGGIAVPTVLAKSGTAVSCGVDVTEDTLATVAVPANAIGPNGSIQFVMNFTTTASTSLKTIHLRFSGAAGTVLMNFAVNSALTAFQRFTGELFNANATNSQICNSERSDGTAGFGTDLGEVSAIDTTAATTLVITGKKAVAGEVLTLTSFAFMLLADGS